MTFTFTKHDTIPNDFLLDHSAPVKLNMLKEKTSHLSKGHFLSNMDDFWPDDCCSHNSCRIRQFICPATQSDHRIHLRRLPRRNPTSQRSDNQLFCG